MVPKSAIIAVIDGKLDEVLADYDLFDAASIKSLPANDLLLQGTLANLAAMHQKFLMPRTF